ncbi:unnamed protein product [Leuciscus chuanchicus]
MAFIDQIHTARGPGQCWTQAQERQIGEEWDGYSQAPGFLSSSPSSSSFCLLDQHAPRLSNTTTCLRLAIGWAALHNDILTGIHNYMAFILSRQDMFKELSVVLNAVGSVHAVEVWTQKTCCPSACQNVIMWEPRSAKTERKKKKRKEKNTVEVLEGKCATVDFGKHFSKLP